MRRGTVYRRCGSCGRRVAGRECAHCGGSSSGWAFTVDSSPPGAPRRQTTKSGFRTKEQALRALNELQAAVADGTHVQRSTVSLGTYLSEWLLSARGDVAATTWESYDAGVRNYVQPHPVSHIHLQALRREDLKSFYADLRQQGAIRSGGGLSAKSVHNVHICIHRALRDAVGSLVARNPAAGAHTVPKSAAVNSSWSAGQLAAFLDHVRDDRLFALWRLAALTGMRRGELAGLQWEAVDLERAVVVVDRARVRGNGATHVTSPKTVRGRRSVDIDPTTIGALEAWRQRQLEELLLLDAVRPEDGLVFTLEDASPLDPDGITQRFNRHVREAGLRRIRFHDLRHTHATLLLKDGVPPHVVSRRLGHASEAFTLQTYGHVLPGQQADAVTAFAESLDSMRLTS